MSRAESATDPFQLNVLLFSVGDVRFGVDLDQVEGMAAYEEGEDGELHWLHETLGFGDRVVAYRLPTILSIKLHNNPSYRIVIDQMEDIVEYGLNAIAPFPALLAHHALKMGIWGVVQRAGHMVLLVDFQRLPTLKPHV